MVKRDDMGQPSAHSPASWRPVAHNVHEANRDEAHPRNAEGIPAGETVIDKKGGEK